MTTFLKADLQNRIFETLAASYPNEGSGFLLGTLNQDSIHVSDIIRLENAFESEEQYHRYLISPQDWIRWEDEAEARGLGFIGCYHSHPDSPAEPSPYDLDYAIWPNFVYIITSVQKGKPINMRAWRLLLDRSRFEEDELILVTE